MSQDRYRNFAELSEEQTPELDYRIDYRNRESKILLMAPHGGRIEFYTDHAARMIAGPLFSCYTFSGIKKRGENWDLHLTSHRFDEPTGLSAAQDAETVVAIHGQKQKDDRFIMLGGLDTELCRRIEKNLRTAGFDVRAPASGMGAVHRANICNRGRSGKGVQMELSAGLRRALMNDSFCRGKFALAARNALLTVSKKRW